MKAEYVVFLRERRTGCWDGYYSAYAWTNDIAQEWREAVDRFNLRYPGSDWAVIVIDRSKSDVLGKPWVDLNNPELWHQEPFAMRVLGRLDD
jgi:hypothetical protein